MTGPRTEQPPDFPSVSELGAREKVAVYFAVALFALCALLSIGLGVYWYRHTPSAVMLTGAETETKLLENLRTQKQIVLDDVSKIFDLFVAKAFLPIFATIIGFLLGKREGAS